MTHQDSDDLLVDAVASLEFYAWNARAGLSLKDRLRIRAASRTIHAIRVSRGFVPPARVTDDRFPCPPK